MKYQMMRQNKAEHQEDIKKRQIEYCYSFIHHLNVFLSVSS